MMKNPKKYESEALQIYYIMSRGKKQVQTDLFYHFDKVSKNDRPIYLRLRCNNQFKKRKTKKHHRVVLVCDTVRGNIKYKCHHIVMAFVFDPYENRTRVTAVKGRCLSRLTNGPYSGSWT